VTRRAFTLIEMMIVVALIVTLMTIAVRLAGIGGGADNRNRTIVRMQRLENCLSGYHAAFGSYPPVKLHGTRDIYQRVSSHGIQTDRRNESIWGWNEIGEQGERDAWSQVEAACRSQPVGCRFPYPEGYSEKIRILSEELKELANDPDSGVDDETRNKLTAGFDDGGTGSGGTGRFDENKDKVDWRNIQLFKFGLMSFVLPRYLVMMNGDAAFFTEYAQWTGNNVIPCDPFNGREYTTWRQVKEYADNSRARTDLAHLANIPSQAVCARWMPNLEGICQCNHKFVLFGVDIQDTTSAGELVRGNFGIEIFSPDNEGQGSYKDQYVLDGVTIQDGWWREFYYYSPAPYQTYTLWSAGPNGRTFPPWISRKKLSSKANECVGKWVHDDVVKMSY
jgi:prepilin-type N-terminal cleavage/methylation domain-containing protein